MGINMTFTWFIFIIQALFASIFLTSFNVGSIPILIVAITSLFYLFDLSRHDYSKNLFLILFLSYLIRLFFLFFDLYGREIFILPNSGLDSEIFHEAAIQGLMSGDFGRGHIYSYFISIMYSFFGNERIISQYFNVLLSMHAILLVYKTMDLYKINDKAKNVAITFIALFPNFAILSSILLRESIIIFLYVLSFYCFTKYLMENNVALLLGSYAAGLLVSVFHSGSIFLVVAYTVFLILYDQQTGQFNLKMKSILLSMSFAFLFLFLFQNYYDVFFSKFSNIEEVGDVIDIYVMGESGYSTGFAIGNPILNFVVNTPLRVFYFVFSPLPWDWRGVTDVLAFFLSSLFYGYTLYLGFRSLFIRNIPNKNIVFTVLLIIGVGLFVFAWGVSNAGTALRHRDKFVGLFTVLLALVINTREQGSERI